MQKPISTWIRAFHLQPLKGPQFWENLRKKWISWSRPKINLFIIRMWKRVATIPSSALRKDLLQYLSIQKCSAHKSGSSLCGMRSDGNPARLWPATQRHFLCPWGSGLPARAISFMENSGLFSGFIKIDEKLIKHMDSSILLATP